MSSWIKKKSISILHVLRLVLCSVFEYAHLHLHRTAALTRGMMKIYLSELRHLKNLNISQIFDRWLSIVYDCFIGRQ